MVDEVSIHGNWHAFVHEISQDLDCADDSARSYMELDGDKCRVPIRLW
jgi:hypothetical protein